MNHDELCWMTASELAAAIAKKKVSPVEVVDATLARIEKLAKLNAYVTLDIGRRFEDATVLRACAAFEKARPWADRRPQLD